ARRAAGRVGQASAPLSRRAVLELMAAAAGGRPRGTEAAATMRLRPIPQGGETIPAVGLGTWRTFDVGASAAPREPLRSPAALFRAGRACDRFVADVRGGRRRGGRPRGGARDPRR